MLRIRGHFGECRSYSPGPGLLLINVWVKTPSLLLDNGLLFAKQGDPQVKAQWCNQGKGACPRWKAAHLITRTCPFPGRNVLLRSTINFLEKSPAWIQGGSYTEINKPLQRCEWTVLWEYTADACTLRYRLTKVPRKPPDRQQPVLLYKSGLLSCKIRDIFLPALNTSAWTTG